MKPTQITELLANIKSSFVSFFSILMFAALGVGVFLGISWAGPALQQGAEGMFNAGQFHHYQISFPYGLTDENLAQLEQVEGVTQVEAERQSFQTLHRDDANYTVKVQSLGQDIDIPLLVEGELPDGPGEMAFHAESAKSLGLHVGDTVTFVHDADETADSGQSKADENKDANNKDAEDKDENKTTDVSDGMQYLAGDTFTITGIIDTADYAAKSSETYGYSNTPKGDVDGLAWVPDATFDAAAFQDGYPIVNVRSENLGGLETFSDAYDDQSAQIEQRISELGDGLALTRYDELHENAQKQVADAEKQLKDAKAKIKDAEKQIKDGEAKLEQARADLDAAVAQGEAELADAYNQLMSGEALKAKAERKLSSARSKLNNARAKLNEVDNMKADGRAAANEMRAYKAEQDKLLKKGKISEKKYNSNLDKHGAKMYAKGKPIAKKAGVNLPKITHSNYEDAIEIIDAAVAHSDEITVKVEGKSMTIGEARAKLAQYEKEYSSAQSKYNKKVAQLNDGWNQYYAGQNELEAKKAQGEQEIADGEAKIKDAKKEVKNGKAEVAENEPKLEEAKEKVAELKQYDWSVLPRSYNAGTGEINTFSSVTNNLGLSMAALFVIVGLLVSYFAVSRIVHEEITQIGTKKALGFRRGEITRSFLLYSGIAVLAGAIIGAIVGYLVVEGIIGGVLGGMFAFGQYPPYFGWPLFLVVTLIELVLVLGATYLACRSILKEQAVVLLRGEKPPTGKERFYEKWAIWEKLPLFMQTIVNNCVNDRRRVLSTVVGVAGAAALIVTAITLNNDVLKSYDRHYEDVYGFNAIVHVDNEVEGAAENAEAALQGQGFTAARVLMKHHLIETPAGKSAAMRIVVPVDEEAFSSVYHVNTVEGAEFDPTADGAWVSQAYAHHMGAKVGDVITVDGGDGRKHEVPILGFAEFWLTYHEMVMGASYYEKEFGDLSANTVLADTGDADMGEVARSLSSVAGFDSAIDDANAQYKNFATFASVSSAVVAIYLALAALMAIVVLLNLNTMFIDEKKRELIVLMINGFSIKDAKRYISWDSVVLTVIGIIVGIILGCVMGAITVSSIEPSTATFVKDADLMAILIGIVGSAILAFIMGKIALRRIPKFKLTDINKL